MTKAYQQVKALGVQKGVDLAVATIQKDIDAITTREQLLMAKAREDGWTPSRQRLHAKIVEARASLVATRLRVERAAR